MATARILGTATEDTSPQGANRVVYDKFTALATGKITEFKVYAGESGHVKVAIYADNSGEPGDKINGNDSSQAVVAGWNTLSISETAITKDTVYWLAVCTETAASARNNTNTGTLRYKDVTFSTWTWPASAGSGFNNASVEMCYAGWGVLVLSPSGLSQPISYGTPKLSLSIYPPGLEQVIAYGTPTVQTAALIIYPPGLQVVIAYGTPALRYPQTISPPGLSIPIAYGTPSVGIVGIISPQGIAVIISYGTPTILKYVWHVILDGQYATETPGVNRAYIIGRDQYGNPVYGTAVDSTELALVGERLDFQPDPAIPTTAQAGDVASAVLSKMRLRGKGGVILIPPNCGQELFDVVQISDAGANQAAVSFRVVGIRFEYSPKQARYQHRLLLGTP
jgi:hypothetical protein